MPVVLRNPIIYADTKPIVESLQLGLLRGRPVVYDYKDYAPVLTSPLDVRRFPFDSQVLEIVFVSAIWEDINIRFSFTDDADTAGSIHVHPDVHEHNTEWLFIVGVLMRSIVIRLSNEVPLAKLLDHRPLLFL